MSNLDHQTLKLSAQQQTIRELSDRIVVAQRPIQILDAVKWGPEIKQEFFKNKCKELPKIDASYYQNRPLAYDIHDKKTEFQGIERDINRLLGQFSGVGSIMLRMCQEYRQALRMIKARGSDDFTSISIDLYGSSEDAFYPGAPLLNDLAVLLSDTLSNLNQNLVSEMDEKRYTSHEAAEILRQRFSEYFKGRAQEVVVEQSDDIIADAAAGADRVKIRTDAMFSERDIRLLEVHEGWVHVGTSLNGAMQPICTFLGKGAPSSVITQEGLSVITEIMTFSSYPRRVLRITNRIRAINMAENGANFLEVFHYFCECGISEEDSYGHTLRIFRGSTPEGGPFTKDLAYAKGFIIIYNYMRLAVQKGLVHHISALFVGKVRIEDLHLLYELIAEGTVIAPQYVPPQFKDLAALSSWMCFSLFLNQLDLKKLSENYRHILPT
ncbi:MAG: flavohemoglobin expression-modulating QEGLA motif protein [Gammaproteobacteria bacterium]|nr:flavohemoglobin expression-modulating QEGLA motif protein [Gammaproteobacteria bacterium]